METLLLVVPVLPVIVVLWLLSRQLGDRRRNEEALLAGLSALSVEARQVGERLLRLEPIPQNLATLTADTNRLAVRVAQLETVPQSVATLNVQASEMATRLGQLVPVGKALDEVRLTVTEMRTAAEQRQQRDLASAESIRRLEMIIAGTQSKGAAGENILQLVLQKLPVEWTVRDFKIDNRTVEFGLLLPNGLVLPVDSKWAATELIEKISRSEDSDERSRLRTQIEATVLARVSEVAKYIDADRTPGYGLAVIPDAAYELCAGVYSDAFHQHKVMIISYSLLVPYLLVVFQTALKTSRTIDLEKLDAHLAVAEGSLDAIQRLLNTRFARSMTMLTNAVGMTTAQISRAKSSLSSVRVQSGSTSETPGLVDVLDDDDDDVVDEPRFAPVG